MKNINVFIFFLLAAWLFNSNIMAQSVEEKKETIPSVVPETEQLMADSLKTVSVNEAGSDAFLPSPIPLSGTAPLFHMYGILPYTHYGYANWDLHKGFNASFGMNIAVGLDSKSPSGVGFGQDAAFLYAMPLNSWMSVAGGVYASNMHWGKYNCRNVGITGIAAFKVTDRITFYGYGNKSLMPKPTFPAYPLPNYTPDKFGGMINFKVGECASFSIGVEAIKNDYPYGFFY